MNTIIIISFIASITALFTAWGFYKSMMKNSEGTEKMASIALLVREGAMEYLKQQYKVVSVTFAVLFGFFIVLAYVGIQNPFVPVAFLTGGFFSGLAGFLGMKTATQASARTAQGATTSLNQALQIAFKSGGVMGLVVVGLGLLDIVLWFWGLNTFIFTPDNMANGLEFWGLTFVHEGMTEHAKLVEITMVMLTFGMGASTQALFARVGGGIYTKAADVGADLAGKVVAGLPEDDIRNPATIADNVGDNVGDVAGMGADLYESFCGSVLATAALGASIPGLTIDQQMMAVLAPMLVMAIGIFASIAGIYMVKTQEDATQKTLLHALLVGTAGSSGIVLIAVFVLAAMGIITWGVLGAVIVGLLAGIVIGQATEYATSDQFKPTRGVAEQAAKGGAATTIIDGLAVGMLSTWPPVVTIVIAIIAAYGFAGGFESFASGVYGLGFAAVGMLSTLGITLATDAFGPIADNAGGNAEMANLADEVRERTDALDSLGNTTAATGKGFAIGSAALTAMALLASYMEEVRLWLGKTIEGSLKIGNVVFYSEYSTQLESLVENGEKLVKLSEANIQDFVMAYNITVFNPIFLGGLFLGAMLCFLFSALTMKAVGRAAGEMVNEIARQFKEIPGIMEGENPPDYARCVSISTAGAQKEMKIPSLLAIIVPIITGVLFGVSGVVGLLTGVLVTGFVFAIFMNNAGGSWDNAKKFIEAGNHGGKNSDAHKAAVIGDTVGDPFKDTSGPSLNILIKLVSMVSVVMTGLTVVYPIF